MMMGGRPGGGRPGQHGMMGGPDVKVQDFKGTMKKLIAYLGEYRKAIIVVFIFAIGSTAASIIGPKILGEATTILFEGVMAEMAGTGSIDFDAI